MQICQITKSQCAQTTSIIPEENYTNSYIKKSQYNKITLHADLIKQFNTFRFTIYPQPIKPSILTSVKQGNGMFKIICADTFTEIKSDTQICLPLMSKYFIRWHFAQFVTKHKSLFSYKLDVNPELYIEEVIDNITNITSCLYDEDKDVIMTSSIHVKY
jgi:hypothetical protein